MTESLFALRDADPAQNETGYAEDVIAANVATILRQAQHASAQPRSVLAWSRVHRRAVAVLASILVVGPPRRRLPRRDG